MSGGTADIVDVHGGTFVHLAGAAGDHQRHAHRLSGHQRNRNALGFHGEHEIGRGIIKFAGDDDAHLAHDVRHAEDIAQVQEAAGQKTGRILQLCPKFFQKSNGVLVLHAGAVAHAAGRTGHGVQPAQTEGLINVAQNIDVFAQRGLGSAKEVTELRQRVNLVGGSGQQLRQRCQSFIAADSFHG